MTRESQNLNLHLTLHSERCSITKQTPRCGTVDIYLPASALRWKNEKSGCAESGVFSTAGNSRMRRRLIAPYNSQNRLEADRLLLLSALCCRGLLRVYAALRPDSPALLEFGTSDKSLKIENPLRVEVLGAVTRT